MAETSAIEWTDATFNPWVGCTKVSAACDHCYAETLSKARLGVPWGAEQPRRRTSVQNWNLPLRWNRKAAREGRRMRVFCASLADVFDAEVPDEWRDELFALIAATPHLDWLLLTKRPKVMRDYIAALPDRRKEMDCHSGLDWCEWPLPNVWLGTTVEDQKMAEARIPHLLATPAAARFLSMEPLLGPVDLGCWLNPERECNCGVPAMEGVGVHAEGCRCLTQPGLDWVITGGESGPGARPSHPDWFRSIRDQCAAAGVPFLFKQHGDWIDERMATAQHCTPGPEMFGVDGKPKGDRWHFYNGEDVIGGASIRIGKKAAGRLLDGVEHNGFPDASKVERA